MSQTKECTLWCDVEDCFGHYMAGLATAKATRRYARENGWACHSDGDFCPKHNTK